MVRGLPRNISWPARMGYMLVAVGYMINHLAEASLGDFGSVAIRPCACHSALLIASTMYMMT